MSQPAAEARMDRAALALVVLFLLCCAALGAVLYAGFYAILKPAEAPQVRRTMAIVPLPPTWWRFQGQAPARAAE